MKIKTIIQAVIWGLIVWAFIYALSCESYGQDLDTTKICQKYTYDFLVRVNNDVTRFKDSLIHINDSLQIVINNNSRNFDSVYVWFKRVNWYEAKILNNAREINKHLTGQYK
jgi:hypothetical protein